MQNRAGGILVLLVHGLFVFFFFKMHTLPHYDIWQTGLRTDGIISDFAFDKGMQGKLAISYRVQGSDHSGTVGGFFADFEEGKPIDLLISNDTPDKVHWSSPIRFWFIDIIIIGIWGGIVFVTATHYLLGLSPFKRQASGMLLAAISLVGGSLVYQSNKSIEAFLKVSEKAMATVTAVSVETCTRKSGDDDVSYTCYRPTYTYSYGRRTYTKLSENTYKESPQKGDIQALQVWVADPATAKKASRTPPWVYKLFMGLFVLLFMWAVWLFLSFSTGMSIE